MKKQDKITWAITQYQAGDKVRDICAAINITTPTLYRWIRTQIEPRRPGRWSDGTTDPIRSEASKNAWKKRFTSEEYHLREKLKKTKGLSLLELLNHFGLSLTLDHMGHAMVHCAKPGRLYLTDTEFKLLSKDPIGTLKQLSNRINATFKEEE